MADGINHNSGSVARRSSSSMRLPTLSRSVDRLIEGVQLYPAPFSFPSSVTLSARRLFHYLPDRRTNLRGGCVEPQDEGLVEDQRKVPSEGAA